MCFVRNMVDASHIGSLVVHSGTRRGKRIVRYALHQAISSVFTAGSYVLIIEEAVAVPVSPNLIFGDFFL